MGFKTLIKDLVGDVVMPVLGQTDGLAPNQTYVKITADAYDPATMEQTRTRVSYENVPMVLARYSIEEMEDADIVYTDYKVIIASKLLAVTPTEDDEILLDTGETYLVYKVGGVPGESVWILQIRKTTV